MGIFDLFSKRQKRLRGDLPDVYSYDSISQPLRVQIVHIWQDTIGNANEYHDSYLGAFNAYKLIVDALCREYGVFKLTAAKEYSERNYLSELASFLLQEQEAEKVLDAIELSFRVIDRITRDYRHLNRQGASERADEAIEELNARFQEHAVGFQFTRW